MTTKRTIMTFADAEKTALNLSENLELPFETCQYTQAIITDATALVNAGLKNALYIGQSASTVWAVGEDRISVKNGKINRW